MIRQRTYLVLFLALVVLAEKGCVPDAPHENPMDPASKGYTESGTLTGKVLSYYEPFSAIAGALVTVQGSGMAAWTNSAGAFLISGIPSGKAGLVVSRAGFRNDTVSVDVPIGREFKVDIHLDALPVIGLCQVITRKIDQWWPRPVYSAVASASVTDPDGLGDVASATLQVDTMRLTMTYVPALQMYQATVNATNLPQGNLEWLVGKQISVLARDKVGATAMGVSFSITRIIQDAPIPIFPTALDTASASPALFWAQPSLQFPYSYKLEMFKLDQGIPSPLWSMPDLSSSLSSFQYPDRLPAGLFFWTISVVDEYGNISRSKEASFYVFE